MLVWGMRTASLYRKKEWINPGASNRWVVENKKKDCWFGYYDVQASQSKLGLELCVSAGTGSEEAVVSLFDLHDSSMREVARTAAWNWQMGCRAQWWGDDEVLFNDFCGGAYISRIVGMDGTERGRFGFPVYTATADKRFVFYPDFEILGALRPGYGYSNRGVDLDEYYPAALNGVFVGDCRKNESRCLLTMEQILKIDPVEDANPRSHYINHLSACPYADKLMFFHLWNDDNGFPRNHVLVVDFEGKLVALLKDFDAASHYAWKDGCHLLLTVIVKGKCEYRLYDLRNGCYELFGHLSVDGHPSYVGADLFVTDTYPDHLGMQHVILCSERAVLAEIATVYHSPGKVEELRCDAHPRYAEGLLSFDSVPGDFRKQHIVEIDLSPEGVEALEKGSAGNSGFLEMYKRLGNTLEAIPLKVLYNRMTNVGMKAHYRLGKMLSARGHLRKLHHHNLLQTKYGIWISPECKIGKRFRMMHMQGITIGSGVVVGDDCVLYQQVTLGKEKGKFPVVGNGVTIYAGAKVLGDAHVGNGAVIGANAVVLKDVPDGAVAVGVPARIIDRASKSSA